MRDEALALPLEDRRAASRRSHRARNIDTAMAAAGFAPTQGTITLAQEFEQPSTNQTRATKAGRTTDCGCGGRHAVRHANVMCATQRAPATSADAARTSETPENWIGSRLARASRLPLTGTCKLPGHTIFPASMPTSDCVEPERQSFGL